MSEVIEGYNVYSEDNRLIYACRYCGRRSIFTNETTSLIARAVNHICSYKRNLDWRVHDCTFNYE
jgi:L-lysine 2,3-aminomutase